MQVIPRQAINTFKIDEEFTRNFISQWNEGFLRRENIINVDLKGMRHKFVDWASLANQTVACAIIHFRRNTATLCLLAPENCPVRLFSS
jgi:hypothetical protein